MGYTVGHSQCEHDMWQSLEEEVFFLSEERAFYDEIIHRPIYDLLGINIGG